MKTSILQDTTQTESKLPLLIFQTCLKVLSEAKIFQILATQNVSDQFSHDR